MTQRRPSSEAGTSSAPGAEQAIDAIRAHFARDGKAPRVSGPFSAHDFRDEVVEMERALESVAGKIDLLASAGLSCSSLGSLYHLSWLMTHKLGNQLDAARAVEDAARATQDAARAARRAAR